MITPTSYLYGAAVTDPCHDHSHVPAPNKGVPGHGYTPNPRGGYGTHYHMCAHAHHEMNYRKKHLGWKAYAQSDSFAPFQTVLPRRHMEGLYPGRWFAAGHYDLRVTRLSNTLCHFSTCFLGFGVLALYYVVRHTRNGWVIKNKGAVSGTD
eukprot:PhF_6_TR24526/c0_g1_i1/m.33860